VGGVLGAIFALPVVAAVAAIRRDEPPVSTRTVKRTTKSKRR